MTSYIARAEYVQWVSARRCVPLVELFLFKPRVDIMTMKSHCMGDKVEFVASAKHWGRRCP